MADQKGGLTVQQAMMIAIASWAGMLMLLLVLLGLTVGLTWPVIDVVDQAEVDAWFISSMVLVAVLPTVAAFIHRYLFLHRRTERGTVTPAGYLQASLTLWGAIAAAGVWGVLGCLMARELIPHVIPVFIAMFLLLGTWPHGRAMVKAHSRESDDDTEILHIPPEEEE